MVFMCLQARDNGVFSQCICGTDIEEGGKKFKLLDSESEDEYTKDEYSDGLDWLISDCDLYL